MLLGTIDPKQPAETYPVWINFANELDAGETLTGTPTITAKRVVPNDGLNVSGTFLSGIASVDPAGRVEKRVVGGTPGDTYRIQMLVTTTGNNAFEHELDVPIVEV